MFGYSSRSNSKNLDINLPLNLVTNIFASFSCFLEYNCIGS